MLANFCQNHSGEFAEYLIHLYDFLHSIAPQKGACFIGSTTVSGDSCYDKEVLEWVMDEVVINNGYNNVVICSNKSYNNYKIIFILYEYIYIYINHF